MSIPPNDNSDLRRLLDDAVSDVHPEGGTNQIRSRARRSSAGRWVPLTVAATVATVLVIGGAAWLAQRQPEQTPAAGPGTITPTEDVTPTEPAAGGRSTTVVVYFVGQTASGPRLFSEEEAIENASVTDLEIAVLEAVRSQPQDADYTNPFKALDLTAKATATDGIVTIDFSTAPNRPAGMSEEEAQMALQALVWTADAAAKGNGAVQFTAAGMPVSQVLGVPTPGPVARASADSVLSTVSISSPSEGGVVPTRFDVTGQAATFEANVVWELKQNEKVVRHGFTTAAQCCTQSPYKFTVTAAPGDYTLVVHDTDESDGEGVGTSEDTKQITVK